MKEAGEPEPYVVHLLEGKLFGPFGQGQVESGGTAAILRALQRGFGSCPMRMISSSSKRE